MMTQLDGWTKRDGVYKAACEYKIVSESAEPGVRAFPRCSDTNWGFSDDACDRFGLATSSHSALVAAPEGRAEISFARFRDVHLHAKLVCEDVPDVTLRSCVSVDEYDSQVSYTTPRHKLLSAYTWGDSYSYIILSAAHEQRVV